MENWQGKVAIVTGANQGIGLAVSKRLSERGVKVVLASNKADELAAAQDQLRAQGGEALAFALDVRDKGSVDRMVQETLDTYGRIDILVNNAGVSYFGGVQQCTEEQWDETMGINLKGYFLLAKAVLPHMIAAKSGSVINMSSIWGKKGSSSMVAYSTSKFAIEGFTQSLSEEAKPHGIKVASIVLDKVDTPFRDNMVEFVEFNDEQKQRMLAAEDVADSVEWILSSSNRSLPSSIHLDAFNW
ncbi:MAG TPA: SDR family oxidoreductase [Bacilli bacterium]|nr:SDR family oxidoreductase [Bacilli bacterium]